MTDNNYLQQELEKTKIAYQEALQSSVTKGGFLGRIAHEIRSPLSSLMGLHQLIINDLCESKEEEREFITEAYQYGKRLMTIIDQLIEVSKLEGGKTQLEIETLGLKEIFDNVYNIVELQAINKNIKLNFLNIDDEILIHGDRVKLQNALIFLLEIVIDYTPRGVVTLEINSEDKDIVVNIIHPHENLNFSENINLMDTPIEELRQLNHLPQLSSGMKLMLVENLLKMMGGGLKLEGNETSPNRWQIFLPVATASVNL